MNINAVFHKHGPTVGYWGDWGRTNIQYRIYERLCIENPDITFNSINWKPFCDYKEFSSGNVVGIDSPQNMTLVNPENNKTIIFNIGPRVEGSFSHSTGFKGLDIVQIIGGASMSKRWYDGQPLSRKEYINDIRIPIVFPMDKISEEIIARDYNIDRETKKINKAIFIGNLEHRGLPGRDKISKILNKHPLFEITQSIRGIKFKDYLDKMNEYKISLSLNGLAEMCYRDWESMAISIPILRSEIYNTYSPDIVADYHYISGSDQCIDGSTGYAANYNDIADQFISKIEDVIDNDELLKRVGKNGRNYFEQSILSEKIIDQVIKKINLNLLY